MKAIRFSGLVRLANGVQRELSRTVTPQRREQLRNQVHRALDLIDRTLRVHSASLRAVPGPSRRAYEFLRSVDWDQAATHEDAQSLPGHDRQVVLRGLSSRIEAFADELARCTANPAVVVPGVRRNIDALLGTIESLLSRSRHALEQVTARSRAHVAWLRYLGEPENLLDYVDALERARRVFEVAANPERWPRPLVIHFRPTQSVFRARAEIHSTRVLLPTPMISLSDAEFADLGRAIFGRRDRRRNAALHAMLTTDSYQEVQSALEALGGSIEETRGMVHDLAASFDRVNLNYFTGQMPRPRLSWNSSITAGKFGHYHYAADTVMISRALDRPQVPEFVVDHVMHHELLHKKHGLRWRNGRSHAHTPEFRREEQLFGRYREADRFLRQLAAGTRPDEVRLGDCDHDGSARAAPKSERSYC